MAPRPAAGPLLVALTAAALGCGASSALPAHFVVDERPCTPPAQPLPVRALPAARGGLLVGQHMALRFYDGDVLCNLAGAARRSGAGGVREDVGWEQVQPRPGTYDWAASDRVALAAARFGLVLLPLLDGQPAWSRGRLVTGYARFVAAAVRRYGPGGALWRGHPELAHRAPVWFELWNEPYEPTNRDRLSARTYARLVRAAVRAGRAADPRARFLAEGEAAYRHADGAAGDWMADLFAADPNLGDVLDGVAVHPYSRDPPAAYAPSRGGDQVGRLELVHTALLAHGVDVPLWITELGWSTCGDRAVCVSESQQAADLREALRLARTRWRPYVRALFVFGYQDGAPAGRGGRELHFGVTDQRQRPKPAWNVVRRAGLAAARLPPSG